MFNQYQVLKMNGQDNVWEQRPSKPDPVPRLAKITPYWEGTVEILVSIACNGLA